MKSLTKWKKIISVMVAIAIVAVAVILAAVQAGAAKTGTEVVYKETRVEFDGDAAGFTSCQIKAAIIPLHLITS